MFKIKILTIGKSKKPWLQDAIEEYEKRLSPNMTFEWIFVKTLEKLFSIAQKEPFIISLDPKGMLLNSKEFSKKIYDLLEKKGSRLTFIIGGPDGLCESLKKLSTEILSLSLLTFTHQLTRLVLIEQLYRAMEIAKGSSYHK